MAYNVKALIIAGLLASLPVGEGVSQAEPTTGTPSAGVSFESSFRTAFQASAQQLLTCLANDTGTRTRTILFIGIPQSDTHFAESQRRALNSIAVKVINGTGLFRAAQVEGIDRVAPVLERRSADELRQTLARNYDAPAIVTFRTHRPDIDVVQLNLLIFGRGQQENYNCTESASLLLDPRTLKTRPRPAVDLDLTSLHGAYADGLSKLSHGIRRQKSLTVSVSTELPGHCGLKASIAADFETVLFDRKRSAPEPDVGGKADTWPLIVSGEARPDAARLTLSLTPSRIDPRILNLKLALKRDGVAIDSASYRVVVPLLLLAGCEPPLAAVLPKNEDVPSTSPRTVKRTPARRLEYCYVDDVRPPDAWLALRSVPSTRRGRQLARLGPGTRFVMTGERQGYWYQVKTEFRNTGWVSWQKQRWITCTVK